METGGDKIGEITPLNKDGRAIVFTLRLNNEEEVEDRRKWLDVLRATAVADESRFRKLLGYPEALPNLAAKKEKHNVRPKGISRSALHLRQVTKILPEWY